MQEKENKNLPLDEGEIIVAATSQAKGIYLITSKGRMVHVAPPAQKSRKILYLFLDFKEATATEEGVMSHDESIVHEFFAGYVTVLSETNMSKKGFYTAFLTWCDVKHRSAVSRNAFWRYARRFCMFQEQVKNNKRYVNLALHSNKT